MGETINLEGVNASTKRTQALLSNEMFSTSTQVIYILWGYTVEPHLTDTPLKANTYDITDNSKIHFNIPEEHRPLCSI